MKEESKNKTQAIVLIGDIGATNARFQLQKSSLSLDQKRSTEIIRSQTLPTNEYETMDKCILKFLQGIQKGQKWPQIAVLGVAGPLADGRVLLTNTKWPTADQKQLEKELAIKHFKFLNDFVILGYGVLNAPGDCFIRLTDAPVQEGCPIGIVGAGTGLGHGYLTKGEDSKQYSVHGSQGGHTQYPPRTQQQFALLQHARKQLGVKRISIERVCAGPAIPLIFRFVRQGYPDLKTALEEKSMTNLSGSEIFKKALVDKDEACVKALEIFVSIYGCCAGNFATHLLCYGGMYLAGGVTIGLKDYLRENPIFMDNFLDKGRLKSFMEKIPIFILNKEIGLYGAEEYSFRVLKNLKRSQ